jgi:hypothetical protein
MGGASEAGHRYFVRVERRPLNDCPAPARCGGECREVHRYKQGFARETREMSVKFRNEFPAGRRRVSRRFKKSPVARAILGTGARRANVVDLIRAGN